jgi:hypothetical protein
MEQLTNDEMVYYHYLKRKEYNKWRKQTALKYEHRILDLKLKIKKFNGEIKEFEKHCKEYNDVLSKIEGDISVDKFEMIKKMVEDETKELFSS